MWGGKKHEKELSWASKSLKIKGIKIQAQTDTQTAKW
jgi:hypothetical protein